MKPESGGYQKGYIIRETPSAPSAEDLFAIELPYGMFFHEPDLETWQAYYDFLYIRHSLKNFPNVVPETEYDIPVVLNARVQNFITYFQGSGRHSFGTWLSRSGKYIPMMKEILAEWGMPTDLVYMAMIESGFSTRARSHKGAVGPWQFIPSTARRYGLRVDSWVDERMDPEKSTVAAANYLRDLYSMFESWELAAAGYNCGGERVRSAIQELKVSDFWEISEHTLPRETKDYVPKFMAALVIAKNPEKYGFRGIEYQEPDRYEKVRVPAQRSLREIGRVIGVSSSTLENLNPSLINDSTPPGDPYEVSVPWGYGKVVTAKYSEIEALNRVEVAATSHKNAIHRVRRGETLSGIARRYGVSVSSLKRANGVRGSMIRIGQVLSVPGASGYSSTYVSSNGGSTKHRVRGGETLGGIAVRYGTSVSSIKSANRIRGSMIRVGQVLSIPNGKGSAGGAIAYRVKRGDTLWEIANRYNVSVSSIKKWNNLRSSKIALGDRLTIYLD